MKLNETHDLGPLSNRLVNALIREWISVELDLMRAGTGKATPEERAKQDAIDEVQHLALAGYSYQLTPQIIDELRRSGQLAPESPP